MLSWGGRVFPTWLSLCVKGVAVLRQYRMIFSPLYHHMYTCFSFSNLSDQSCLKCCSNCPINTPYVNCIMPRKQEDKTSNRHNQPLLLPLGLICHWINTDNDTRWQQTGWYHLSSRATKGASVYDMWRATLTVSLTILQCVRLTGGRASRETACSSREHCKQQKIRASSNRYYKKILSQSIGEILDFTKSKNVLIEGVLKTQHFTEQNDIHRTQKTSLNILKCLVFLCCVLTLRATTV